MIGSELSGQTFTQAAAEFQVPQVAKARNLSPDKVRARVAEMTQERSFGVLCKKRVNVFELVDDIAIKIFGSVSLSVCRCVLVVADFPPI
jgi:K+-transporting ATPase c subunit